ncbi:diphosphoinositol-polyphosphate diphosphatase [Ranunculus cassubicifolius]
MSSLEARVGRDNQRYDKNFRLVAGCIPYRMKEENEEQTDCLENTVEVLMISSPNRDDLVFPKGGWENDETMCEAACREALEEAGVKGVLDENALGFWEFRSKSSQNSCTLEGYCRGYMFALKVEEEFCNWAEEDCHRRRWLSITDAFGLCRYEWMQEALDRFLVVMSESLDCPIWKTIVETPSPQSPALPVQTASCFINSSSIQRLDEPYAFGAMNYRQDDVLTRS